MYLKAMFLPYLMILVKTENYLEYTIGNFIDLDLLILIYNTVKE